MSFIRVLYVVFGTISLALGIIGIFVPLLPTTPFLLLTAFLYFKGSTRCYNWLLNHPQLGPYIRNFREKKVIPRKTKIISITIMWISILLCVFIWIPFLWAKIILILISIGVTIHILSFKNE